MSECYLGEIRIFAGNYAPVGWEMCNGQLLSVSQYQALFTLLGTTYGGNGTTTFGLPDLRGRVPIHKGNGYTQGMAAGTEEVTLLSSQLPSHTHIPAAQSAVGSADTPNGAVWAASSTNSNIYTNNTAALEPMAPTSIMPFGGSQPHENMMPYMALSFIIAVVGIFPTQQ